MSAENNPGGSSSAKDSKRKIDQVESDCEDSTDDEEGLFLPQARSVLAQSKKPNVAREDPRPSLIEEGQEEEEDIDDEEWLTDEEDESEGEVYADSADEEQVEEEEEEAVVGETLEELGAGREEKEEDEVVLAICNGTVPHERNKPRDVRTSCMVTDISFHPNEDIIAVANIEGEITW